MALRATDGDEDAAGAAGRCPPERTLPVRYRAATARERTPLVRYRAASSTERSARPRSRFGALAQGKPTSETGR